jgi:hypothetical protein
MGVVRMGMNIVIMLAWGLSLTLLTLKICRIAEEQHLVAGAFLSAAYGLLATPLLHWLAQ